MNLWIRYDGYDTPHMLTTFIVQSQENSTSFKQVQLLIEFQRECDMNSLGIMMSGILTFIYQEYFFLKLHTFYNV